MEYKQILTCFCDVITADFFKVDKPYCTAVLLNLCLS